jgi:hypothetical protein
MDREYRFCGFEGHVEGVLEAFRTVSGRCILRSPGWQRPPQPPRPCQSWNQEKPQSTTNPIIADT